MKKILFFLAGMSAGFSAPGQSCSAAFHIVVLGSSTAFGIGTRPIRDSSWVNRYAHFLHQINSGYVVTNLSFPGYDTYCIQPDGFQAPPGRRRTDTLRNITRALSLKPDAILINLPSNDQAEHIPTGIQKENFLRVVRLASRVRVPVWVTTTQPRNLDSADIRQILEMRDWITKHFGDRSIDFWSSLADSSGRQDSLYGAGDGIHLNNAGHRILFQRVLEKKIPDQLCRLHHK